MKKITNKNLRLNKINVSKLNAQKIQTIFGGNTANTCVKKTNEETCDPCTTSRSTVDFSSDATNC